MQFIKIIPSYNESLSTNFDIIPTKISINDIESKINTILDKHSDICKYYINCDEASWVLSFNVGFDQIEAMIQTMVVINLFKDSNNISILTVSKEINEHQQWQDVHQSLFKKLKN